MTSPSEVIIEPTGGRRQNPTVFPDTSHQDRLATADRTDVKQDTLIFERGWPVAWPVLGLILVSLLIRWTNFDLLAAGLFYDRVHKTWPYEVAQPWLSIYRHGTIPSIVMGIGGAVVAIFGKSILPRFGWKDSRSTRRAGWFLACLLFLGPGLIINVGFKELWGRPRPLQCVEFGGEKQFLPVGTWARQRSSNSSFPSGHAAVAFYLMAPGFVAGRKRYRLKLASFLVGAVYGVGMGLTRVVQGGHFVSDVLWAGAIVYLTGVALAWLILRNDDYYVNECTTSPESNFG